MLQIGHDLRYAFRVLRRAPGFTVVAAATLALGIGATTAIFSVVDAVLLKPLPFRDPRNLVVIWEKNFAQHKYRLFVAGANFRDWQQQSRSFEGMAAIQDSRINLTGGPNGHIDPEELCAERVSASLFPLLGVQATIGRAFRAEEDQPANFHFALLSHRLWVNRFAADPSIAGKPIRLQDQSYTVLGVMPAGFAVIDPEIDLWLPLAFNPADPRAAVSRNSMVVARLRPGVSIDSARSEMESIGANLERANAAVNSGWRPSVFPLRDELTGSVEQPLLVLLAAVGFLLLMACVNVANLLLARGTARRKEIAVGVAIGASRGRVLRQLLAESVLLGIAGCAGGILLAAAAIAALSRIGAGSIPRLADAQIDLRVLLFSLAVSLVTGIVFGLIPAWQVSGSDLNPVLAEGGRGGSAGRSNRMLRNAFIMSEVALAVVVLIGAGLLIRSFIRLRAADPGFQPAGLLTARIPLAGGRNSATDRRIAFLHDLSQRLAALPGVRAVGAISALPLTGMGTGTGFAIEGRPVAPDQRPIALVRAVTPSYFRTIGIPLRAGRGFTDADTRQSPLVVVVNETLARRFWPGPDFAAHALGSRLLLPNGRVGQIVGIVGDVKADKIESDTWATIYSAYPQLADTTMILVLRTAGPPLAMASAVEREVHQLDPDQPVSDVRTMESVIDRAASGARFNSAVLGVFAAIAFLLAAVGIYGVMAYDVTRRTNEIGIRMALGADPTDVLKLIIGEGARLAGAGIVIGLAAALGLTRLMAGMLYGVKATDAWTFVLMSVLLSAVALFSGYLASRRALALDPVTALRHE